MRTAVDLLQVAYCGQPHPAEARDHAEKARHAQTSAAHPVDRRCCNLPLTGRWNGALVAIKVIDATPFADAVAIDAARESLLAASMSHPNVVRHEGSDSHLHFAVLSKLNDRHAPLHASAHC